MPNIQTQCFYRCLCRRYCKITILIFVAQHLIILPIEVKKHSCINIGFGVLIIDLKHWLFNTWYPTPDSNRETSSFWEKRLYQFVQWGKTWSEWKDSNLRSPAPKAGGLNQTFLHSVITWYGWRDSNPQNSDFKSDTYTYSVTSASNLGAPEETRTPKIWLLRPTRIPIPSPGQSIFGAG